MLLNRLMMVLQLLARNEDSDHMVHQLQQQLVELQKRDTLSRARERNDEIVSSLKER